MKTAPAAPKAARTFPAPMSPVSGRGVHALRVVGALILREMTTTYGRSPGGWLWALVEPIAVIALLSFAFSLIFVAPPLGRDFALFYATGFLPFFLFLDVSNKGAAALRFSRPLLGFGGVSWVDALVARIVLNGFTQIFVGAVVLVTLWHLADGAPLPDHGDILTVLAMSLALATGVATFNAYVTSAFPVWERLWSVAMRPMFIISGVVFLLEDAPRNLQMWLAWNPLFHITGAMRAAFYPSYHPSYVSPVFVVLLGLGLTVVGACLLSRAGNDHV